jgi:hypothetical protein
VIICESTTQLTGFYAAAWKRMASAVCLWHWRREPRMSYSSEMRKNEAIEFGELSSFPFGFFEFIRTASDNFFEHHSIEPNFFGI